MKRSAIQNNYWSSYHTNTFLLVAFFLLTLVMEASLACATPPRAGQRNDIDLSAEISRQLGSGSLQLNYPLSVKRHYAARRFAPAWLVAEPDVQHTWAAMLMIDCVLQFGLNQVDYHPKELLYSDLHDMIEHPDSVPLAKQARFEIMLTDAMITFINNLHFGKYNPEYPGSKIDRGGLSFDAVNCLGQALQSKDLMAAVVEAQPKGKWYRNLQERLHKVAGVQVGDCYEFPENEVRKIALNMERLRWALTDTDNFIQVNIPSFKLSYNHNGAVDTFRVIVGKPSNPTPSLNSKITYFTTAPEWRVPKRIFLNELLPKAIRDTGYLNAHHYTIYNDAGMMITPTAGYLVKIKQNSQRYHATQSAGCDNALGQIVFRFQNIYDIYLHDTPERELFYRQNRALSHGCIRVQQPKKLARALLTNDGRSATDMEDAYERGIKKNFYLKRPVPIAITYVTCEMVDGQLVVYDDVYQLDNSLDQMLYRRNDPTLNIGQK